MIRTLHYALIMVLIFFITLCGPQAIADKASAVEKKPLYWVAPMDANFRRDKPGKSPMGMDLVPVYADESTCDNADQGGVRISPAVKSSMGVRTAMVMRKTLPRIIQTVGNVRAKAGGIQQVHTYTAGWIKKLVVRSVGQKVKVGDLLFSFYSREVVNAEKELLIALSSNQANMLAGSKKKLEALGVSEKQINAIIKQKHSMPLVDVYATEPGVVAALNVRQGAFVKPDTLIMTIKDLNTIWVIAHVYPKQAAWIQLGQSAKAELSYYPSRQWAGQVDYIYPELDPKTHTLKVRTVFPNPKSTLKPNMFAHVTINASSVVNAIAIPTEALMRFDDGDRVIVETGDGVFTPKSVRVGIESGDFYQIKKGLSVGDKVVTSGQFLIDSEASVKASFTRMDDKK